MSISARARELFLAELAARGATPTLLDDGGYELQLGEMKMTINLENKGREFDETGDEEVIKHFVNTIMEHTSVLPSAWDTAKSSVYFSAEPSDHKFGDTCRIEVSDQVALVLVYLKPEGQHIVWLTPNMLTSLGVSREVAEHHAAKNLARLLSETPIETVAVGEHQLGMLSTHSPLKASLIFANNLREKVEPILGWPVYAVIPCRDFAYLIPESAQEIYPGIGQVVVQEYTKRGYPITTEVFKIDDEKVVAVGEFQSPYNPPKGMRAIEHDRLVTFFLPQDWEDEERDDGAVIYYDPDEDENYLLIITRLFSSEADFPADMARQALTPIAEQENVDIRDWPGNRATIFFMAEEGDLQTWTWALSGPVTPKHQGLVAFTYHMPLEEAESEETQATISMLHEMLPRALFRPDLIDEDVEGDDE